jgi:aspartate carbamoyltransferase regulatory subunit
MEKGGKKLIVSAIENGTVFDHIPANQLFKVISILGLQDCQNQVTLGTNIDSKLLGKKSVNFLQTYFRILT